jgi:hypothetical protein
MIPFILPYLSKMISVNTFNVLDTMPLLNLTLVDGIPQGYYINTINTNYSNCDTYINPSTSILNVFGCVNNVCNSSRSSVYNIKGNTFTQNYGDEFEDIFNTNRMIMVYCYTRYEIVDVGMNQLYIDENKMKFLNSLNESELLSFIENNGQMFLGESRYGGEVSCTYIMYESIMYPNSMHFIGNTFLDYMIGNFEGQFKTGIKTCPSMNTLLNTQEQIDDLVNSVVFSVVGGNPSLFNNSFDDWYLSLATQPALIEWWSGYGMDEIVNYNLMSDITKSIDNINSYFGYERTLFISMYMTLSANGNEVIINTICQLNNTKINEKYNDFTVADQIFVSVGGSMVKNEVFNPPTTEDGSSVSVLISSNNNTFNGDTIELTGVSSSALCDIPVIIGSNSCDGFIYTCTYQQSIAFISTISINRCYNITGITQC